MSTFFKSLLILLLIFLSGCGESPFFKDEKREEGPLAATQSLQSDLSFNDVGLEMSAIWRQGPFISDESKVLIIFTESGRSKKIPYDLSVKLWMPSMGHGSFPILVKEISDGVYELSDVYFTMKGYWDMHFQLFRNGELVEEVKWSISL